MAGGLLCSKGMVLLNHWCEYRTVTIITLCMCMLVWHFHSLGMQLRLGLHFQLYRCSIDFAHSSDTFISDKCWNCTFICMGTFLSHQQVLHIILLAVLHQQTVTLLIRCQFSKVCYFCLCFSTFAGVCAIHHFVTAIIVFQARILSIVWWSFKWLQQCT